MQPRITFTTFLDFVTANELSKLARVRTALGIYTADDYRRADYYLDLKHAIARCFSGGGLGSLDACLTNVKDDRKRPHYSAAITGIKRWVGRKRFDGQFPVPQRQWRSGGLCVTVHPELGLIYKGDRLVIKLYLKDQALDQHRINPLLHLLHSTHGDLGTVGVLDARRANLFKLTRRLNDVDAFLAAEAQHFLTLWDSLLAA